MESQPGTQPGHAKSGVKSQFATSEVPSSPKGPPHTQIRNLAGASGSWGRKRQWADVLTRTGPCHAHGDPGCATEAETNCNEAQESSGKWGDSLVFPSASVEQVIKKKDLAEKKGPLG